MLAGRRDAAPALPRAQAGNIQCAAHVHSAAFHAAQQFDRAVFARDQRLRLDHAGVVDRIGQQAARRLGGHQHLAAIGPDQAAVVHQRIDRALVDGDVQQLVAGHIQRDGIACGQGDGAQLGRNHALVADVRAQQGHIAAVSSGNRSLVHDGARARAGKLVVVGHEVGVGDGQGGGRQTTHIDRGTMAEQDAVGVDQEHLAVG